MLPAKTGIFVRYRDRLRRTWSVCREGSHDLLYTVLTVCVCRPAADFLSRQAALEVARWCGSVVLHMPGIGRGIPAKMQKCFSLSRSEALEESREYLAQVFYQSTVFRRIAKGREKPQDWKIEETNSQEVRQLRESGQSFIVASAHFRRDTTAALWTPQICPGRLAIVTIQPPARALKASTIRMRVFGGELLSAMKDVRPDSELVYVGTGGSGIIKLLQHLAKPGAQVFTMLDWIWESTDPLALTRPFAWTRSRSFSVGAASLARLTRCKIVACATYVKPDGTIVVDYGPVISPPPRKDEAADARITGEMLDFLEIAVGRRPSQYVFYITQDRKWNADLQRWENG